MCVNCTCVRTSITTAAIHVTARRHKAIITKGARDKGQCGHVFAVKEAKAGFVGKHVF